MQTSENFFLHYHIQDGGSTDGTIARLKQWEKALRNNINFFPNYEFSFDSKSDSGMYEGLNRAFNNLSIPEDSFMGWISADDWLWPDCLASVSEISEKFPETDWLTGWRTGMDEFGKLLQMDFGKRLFPQTIIRYGLADGMHWKFIQQESTFWRKKLFSKVGGLDSSLRYAGDWDLWRRFAQITPLTQVARQFGAFRRRINQKSLDRDAYRTEMESRIPFIEREKSMNTLLEDFDGYVDMPAIGQSDAGLWENKGQIKMKINEQAD